MELSLSIMGCACCKSQQRFVPLDYDEMVRSMINSERVVIFSKTTNTDCDDAKRIFQMTGSDYGAIELDDLPENDGLVQALFKRTKTTTVNIYVYGVPQVFIDGQLVGGICQLKIMRDNGILYERICKNNYLCNTSKTGMSNVACVPRAVPKLRPCKIICSKESINRKRRPRSRLKH